VALCSLALAHLVDLLFVVAASITEAEAIELGLQPLDLALLFLQRFLACLGRILQTVD